jgi:hypothetical protein
MRTTRIIIFALITILLAIAAPSEVLAGGLIQHQIKVNDQFSYSQRDYNWNGEGRFFIRRIQSSAVGDYWTSFVMPGTTGTLGYYDSIGNLIHIPLTDGILPAGRLLFLSTERYHYILGQPYIYQNIGNGTMQSIGTQPISVRKQPDGWVISYRLSIKLDSYGIIWGVGSQNKLIDFSNPTQIDLWKNYDLDRNARLAYEGYHYISPSSYRPYVSGSYWRIPSDYLSNSLVRTDGSLASDILGGALVKIAHGNINDEGFLPTLPESLWLKGDYGILAGFFDTRFNADTIETNIAAFRKFGDEEFRTSYLMLSDYYLSHGTNRHLKNFNPDGIEGWLVEDYYGEGGSPTHISLNHQLQAIHVFYMLYEEEADIKYLEFADKMLQGIKNTADLWLMADGNLEYAYLQNGTMGFKDYDYLTYNDLLNVQDDLVRIKGMSDPDLETLLQNKKLWMDVNGIVGYRK